MDLFLYNGKYMIDKNFKFNPIQTKALERLRTVSAHVVALSPGTGKTILILSFIEEILQNNNDKCIFMIPKSARAAFEKEMNTRMGRKVADAIRRTDLYRQTEFKKKFGEYGSSIAWERIND